jgi:hypothetical protein
MSSIPARRRGTGRGEGRPPHSHPVLPFAAWQRIARKRFFEWLAAHWSDLETGARQPGGYVVAYHTPLARYTVVFSAIIFSVPFSTRPYVLGGSKPARRWRRKERPIPSSASSIGLAVAQLRRRQTKLALYISRAGFSSPAIPPATTLL